MLTQDLGLNSCLYGPPAQELVIHFHARNWTALLFKRLLSESTPRSPEGSPGPGPGGEAEALREAHRGAGGGPHAD